MSLTKEQLKATEKELRENLEKSGLSIEQVAADLETTPSYIERLLRVKPRRYEDTWIMKNYLMEKVVEQGKTPTPFTALAVDHKLVWFLDAGYIDGKKIRRRGLFSHR